jgi:GT2 family glycosyltransferase
MSVLQDRFSDSDNEQAMILGLNRVNTPISVIIVSYNSRQYLYDCLASIEREPCEQVTVVDNLSSDGSVEMVKQHFPWVRLILSKKNDGYGAAANLAIAQCPTEYILLLNPDTVLQRGVLQALSDHLDRYPQAAVVGPQLVNPNETCQVSCFEFPAPLETLKKETNLSHPVWRSSKHHSAEFLDAPMQMTQTVPWVLGAAMAIRRTAFNAVGGFDESFFMYYEEVDLCYRLERAGWKIQYAPGTVIMHVGGASTNRQRAAMLQQLYKSLCHFYQQHYSGSQKIQLRLILTYLMLRNIIKDTVRSYRLPVNNIEAVENLSVWRSILASVWSSNGWLKI